MPVNNIRLSFFTKATIYLPFNINYFLQFAVVPGVAGNLIKIIRMRAGKHYL
jgi:hypothetical protein